MPGLEVDVIALPSEGGEGGDLYALFSCGDHHFCRMVLADAVGHGYTASEVVRQVHALLHKYNDMRDPSGLLAALNEDFPAAGDIPGVPLRLTTVVTATYHCDTGEFNYAYAAHPRMLEWRTRNGRWGVLGEGLEGLPLGVISGELYSQQSVKLEPGDLVMAFSDALTEVESPDGTELTAEGFLELAERTMARFSQPVPLDEFSRELLAGVRHYHGSDRFRDDLTLLTLRRRSQEQDQALEPG